MGYQAYNLFTDPTYVRDNARDLEADDLDMADALEAERVERERYAEESVRLPLNPGRPG